MAQFADCYQRTESRESSNLYVCGLLADKVERKNSWQLTEVLGLERPKPLQRLLNESDWEADEVCQRLRRLIQQRLGFTPGVGVIDESGFVKKGEKSAGGQAILWATGQSGKLPSSPTAALTSFRLEG